MANTPVGNRRRSLPSYPVSSLQSNATPSSITNTVNILINKVPRLEANVSDLNDSLARATESNLAKQNEIDQLVKKVKTLEKDLNDQSIDLNTLNQYGRREHLEFVGIKESVAQAHLENYIIQLLKDIHVTVVPSDIVATHRIGKFKRGKNRNVIIKFLNRKHARETYKNRHKLKKLEGNRKSIFIIENLCPAHKSLFNRLYKMYKNYEIYDVWTVNGHVYATFADEEEGVEIRSDADIDYYIDLYYDDVTDEDSRISLSAIEEESFHSQRSTNTPIIPPNSPSAARHNSYIQAVSEISNVTVPPPSVSSHTDSESSMPPNLSNNPADVSNSKSPDSDIPIDLNVTRRKSKYKQTECKKYEQSPTPPRPHHVHNSDYIINLYDIDTSEWLAYANHDDYVYIGRQHENLPGISDYWGNPDQKTDTMQDRERSIDNYRSYISGRPDMMARLEELRGKKLLCFCDPLPCHAEVLLELLRLRCPPSNIASNPHANTEVVDINEVITKSSPSIVDDYFF